MEKYDFDKVIERHGTRCIKFDAAKQRGRDEDVLSYWVADMDFETAPAIKEAIIRRAEHGIYGYSMPDEKYYDMAVCWMRQQHGWDASPNWCVYTPGVVFALAAAVRAFTQPGDSIIIQRPVYYPFTDVIVKSGRKLVNSSLVFRPDENGGRYEMDYEDFERKLIENNVKMFILCSPHNPVGRVWDREELEKIGNLCIAHNVLVVSDEIHQDFVYPGKKHIVFASMGEQYEKIAVTCTSPSKTFNLAGLQVSNIFISDPALKKQFLQEILSTGYGEPNIFGMTACEAAYEYGEDWLAQLKEYLQGNLNYVKEFLAENLPKIKLIPPEGTYLLWLDFRDYGYSEYEMEKKIKTAKLWLDAGTMFGPEGSGYQRINIAAPRKYLALGLEALKQI